MGPGLAGLLQNVRALTRTDVLVGIPAENAGRADGDGINNATIAYMNETGMPEMNIPARPHFAPGIASVQDKIAERFKIAGQAALIGDEATIERQQMAAGQIAVDAIKGLIGEGLSPALSAVTLHRRKTRKVAPRTGEKPLLDTGGYRNAITFVVRERRE